jgi:hypothetical protein
MLKRFLVLAFASLLGIAATSVTALGQQPAPDAAAPQAASNVTGDWAVSATGAKFRRGTYNLQQVNQQIIGKNPEGGQMQGR